MKTMKEQMQAHDLRLTYEEAMHGVQSHIAWAMNTPGYKATQHKHMRVGLDMRAADHMGLVSLLIDKGLVTDEEYREYMRLAANMELKMRELECHNMTFR